MGVSSMLKQYPDDQAQTGTFINAEHMHTDTRTRTQSDEQKESAEAHEKLSAVSVVDYDSAAPL